MNTFISKGERNHDLPFSRNIHLTQQDEVIATDPPGCSHGCQDHFVQFYEDDQVLVESVAAFIGQGLIAGEGAIIIATESHRTALRQLLADHNLDISSLEKQGQLVILDAAIALGGFMADGCPNPEAFRATVGQVVEKTSNNFPRLRAFGEMVALLWAEGNGAGALRLEELWNDLAKSFSFRLYCAYPLNAFSDARDANEFAKICESHTRVLPSQQYFSLNEQERHREIAALQQKAIALESEIKKRREAEVQLRRRESELTNFVENASIGLHWVGPDGVILWANKADYEFLGYSSDEYVGRNIAEFHADKEVIEDILARLWKGERLKDYPAQLKCKNGSLKTVLIDSSVLWEDGKFIHTQCFTRDITEQRQAEESLRQKEERLSQLLSLMPAAVYTCGANGRITYFNKRAAELWGREPAVNDTEEKFCGSYKLKLPDGTPLPHHRTPMANAITQGLSTRNAEVIIERPDGSSITVSVNIDPLRETEGKLAGAINVFQDISQLKNAEKEARRRQQHLETIVENTPECVKLVARDGTLLAINGAGLEVVEADSATDVIGNNIYKLIAPEFREAFMSMNERVCNGAKEKLEFQVIGLKGTRRWMEAHAAPILDPLASQVVQLAVARDITQRKKAHDISARLAAIVEHSEDAIFSTCLKGTIESWNRGAEQLYGYLSEEIIGRSLALVIPENKLEEEAAIMNRINNGKAVENYETMRQRKDGSLFHVSLTVSPIRNENGEVIGISKVARDISEKVRAREKLEQMVAERTASLSEAVAQMEEFSYSVSHDLRAPLRAIYAYATVLMEDHAENLNDTARGYLEKIRRGSGRMDRLTTDVLSYSKLSRANMIAEPIALERLVKDIIHQYGNLQAPAVEIEIESPLLDVLGHEVTLGQCVANLLNNAVKFVAPGVTPHIRVRTEANGNRVRVWFEDNGIGIKPEHQPRIFQMFERVHPEAKYEGTGIGLTIVRKAIEKMYGKVGVESDGKTGSRFWLDLPALNI